MIAPSGKDKPMKEPIDVSIIFVNYKTSHLLRDVINSIKEKSSSFTYEIIIVDNSCDDDERAKLQEFKDVATIIDAKDNLGFGRANNLGVASSRGRYVYFLNTDTLLMNNAIYELVSFLDKNPDVGIVGSNLYKKDGSPNNSCVPFELDLKGERVMNSLWTSLVHKAIRRKIDFNYKDHPVEIRGYVCGASLMMRREDFDSLGGFDKDIFMYAEETLLCYRLIHELGKKIYNVPSSKIIHFEGESFAKKVSYQRVKACVEGNVVYHTKAFGASSAVSYLRLIYKTSRSKRVLARIIGNQEKAEYFTYMMQACKEKLEELGE